MSESDVYRCQLLTYKDGPRAERVNYSQIQKNGSQKLPESVERVKLETEVWRKLSWTTSGMDI